VHQDFHLELSREFKIPVHIPAIVPGRIKAENLCDFLSDTIKEAGTEFNEYLGIVTSQFICGCSSTQKVPADIKVNKRTPMLKPAS